MTRMLTEGKFFFFLHMLLFENKAKTSKKTFRANNAQTQKASHDVPAVIGRSNKEQLFNLLQSFHCFEKQKVSFVSDAWPDC